MRRVILVLIFSVILAAVYGNVFAASTHIVYNDAAACTTGDDYFNTIQSAVDASSAGDTIMVCPGLYQENLYIYGYQQTSRRGLIIKAYDSDPDTTIIQASDPGKHAIYIKSPWPNGIVIRGFKITGATGGDENNKCKLCPPHLAPQCFDDSQPHCAGVRAYCTELGSIRGNHITGNNHGVIIKDTDPTYDFQYSVSENTIDYNNVGVKLQYAGNNIFIYNTISNNGTGIHLKDAYSNQIIYNTVIDNTTGFELERNNWDVNTNRIYANSIVNNTTQISDNTYPDCLNLWYRRYKPTLSEGNYWLPGAPQDASCYDPYPLSGPAQYAPPF